MLDISRKKEDDVLIVTLQGRFDGLGASAFDREITTLIHNERYVVLDLQGVDYLSSAGIRSLVILGKKMKKERGEVYLGGLQPDVKNVLDISGLLLLFDVVHDVGEALEVMRDRKKKSETTHCISLTRHPYELHFDPHHSNSLEIWSHSSQERGLFVKENLYSLTLEELGPTFGIGGLGAEPTDNLQSLGTFLSIGGTAGVLPADGHNQLDYLALEQPEEAYVHIAHALSFSGPPAGSILLKEEEGLSLSRLFDDLYKSLVEKTEVPDNRQPLGFVFLVSAEEGQRGNLYSTLKDLKERDSHQVVLPKGQSIIGVGLYRPHGWDREDLLAPFLHQRSIVPPESLFIGHGLLLSEEFDEYNISSVMDPALLFRGPISPTQIVEFHDDISITEGRIWLYHLESIRKGEEKLLQIEITDTYRSLPREWEIITRRLYAKHSKVVMQPLKGGFSPAKPFRVTGYDQQHRRTLPTVLKVGPIEEVEREYRAYKKYVEHYILNNSTSIMGISSSGSSKGICYNFVGISGPESQLTWLTHQYRERPIQELLPLFDKIFTEILKPWYGQPQWRPIQLYREHSPLGLFPDILQDAERVLGVSADDELLFCPYLKMELPNPYHFLKYTYQDRIHEERLWYTGINHGDLNMQNILIDERETIYIIDFSETGMGNIVSDFARLEPIMRIELTRLIDERDLVTLLEFELGLSKATTLSEELLYQYSGDDPMVEKAFHSISRLREYARRVIIFEDDIVPYLLAILEWVFPIVSYTSADEETKKLGAYSAALMVKQILDLEK